ncbi:MAG: recombinase family protein [Gammaproteobacteria bacterium]|nr:recombinase family protein [Gammaproteobacteria bacterium]
MKIGYARVSTLEQNLASQVDQLQAQGCEKIYRERCSGGDRKRPVLNEMLDYLRLGDTVVVVKLDRLSRSLKDLLDLTARIDASGAQFQSLDESIDTSSPHGKLIFHVFGVIAEFERDRIRQRTLEGLAAARARGRSGGRPFALNRDQRIEVVRMRNEGRSLSELSRLFDISRATIARTCASKDVVRA